MKLNIKNDFETLDALFYFTEKVYAYGALRKLFLKKDKVKLESLYDSYKEFKGYEIDKNFKLSFQNEKERFKYILNRAMDIEEVVRLEVLEFCLDNFDNKDGKKLFTKNERRAALLAQKAYDAFPSKFLKMSSEDIKSSFEGYVSLFKNITFSRFKNRMDFYTSKDNLVQIDDKIIYIDKDKYDGRWTRPCEVYISSTAIFKDFFPQHFSKTIDISQMRFAPNFLENISNDGEIYGWKYFEYDLLYKNLLPEPISFENADINRVFIYDTIYKKLENEMKINDLTAEQKPEENKELD